jgi:hypothetical protein
MRLEEFDIDFLTECFDCNPETGIITWKRRPLSHFEAARNRSGFNSKFAGEECGRTFEPWPKLIYLTCRINGSRILLHRLMFLVHHGFLPAQLDHINGNGCDNRLCNLREATPTINARNKRLYKNNHGGISGVHYDKDRKRWRASIGVKGTCVKLGRFKKFKDAVRARLDAESKYGYDKLHRNYL